MLSANLWKYVSVRVIHLHIPVLYKINVAYMTIYNTIKKLNTSNVDGEGTGVFPDIKFMNQLNQNSIGKADTAAYIKFTQSSTACDQSQHTCKSSLVNVSPCGTEADAILKSLN